MDKLLADTGFIVALGRSGDPLHGKARRFLDDYTGLLVTVSPVIVEACHFFSRESRIHLLNWARHGNLSVFDVPSGGYPELVKIMNRYADREVDFADAALVWLAGKNGVRGIVTTDRGDFSTYRVDGRKHFKMVPWMG